jgi:hypothetical protein
VTSGPIVGSWDRGRDVRDDECRETESKEENLMTS